MEYAKVKSVAKTVEPKGPNLDKIILDTMKIVSDVVGSTLGPGGQPVLIERYEHGLPPMITKDGVTAFRSLGFRDARAHAVMETSRDSAIRTATEAGDGTTTATILSEAIVRYTKEFCKNNPRVSPQRVVRHLEQTFRQHIEPKLKELAIPVDGSTDEGKALLHSVAKVSANGDTDLADAVMECFEITGDEGNVTILEVNGPSAYEVDQIEGYPVAMGYEESCGKFYPKFINDEGTQRCVLENPIFVLYHGRLTEIQTVVLLMEKIGELWQSNRLSTYNVVLVATGFSDSVLGQLALNFAAPNTINVFPLLVPQSPITNGQVHFLQDIAAVTNGKIFDPLNAPLDTAEVIDLGNVTQDEETGRLVTDGVRTFEASRYRSSVVGFANEQVLFERVDTLRTLAENAESQLDALFLGERIAKLTGGIARLKVIGASNGETKEKRDRAEDAVCSVRGAIKHGCIYGGGWGLLKLCASIPYNQINDNVLRPALLEPVNRLLQNIGIVDSVEFQQVLGPILEGIQNDVPCVYDALETKHVHPVQGGILDSLPAVLEAIRNSISIASQLGTLGAIVVFERDDELERQEARATSQWHRDANVNPADERA